MSTRRRMIGYWRTERTDETLPDPRDFIDPEWDEDERGLVADYLRHAQRAFFYMGFSTCRLCGARVGNAEHVDGEYRWPEGLAHYVEVHAVRLPREFVEHVHRQQDLLETAEQPEADWWRAQSPTGTARHWRRWVVQVEGEDRERLRGMPYLNEELRTLADTGRLDLVATIDVRSVTGELASLGIDAAITEERVPVPDELLA